MRLKAIVENRNWNPFAKHPYEKKSPVQQPESKKTPDNEEDVARQLVLKAAKAGRKLKTDREQIVMKFPKTAAYYAKNVLKKRWVEAEDTIRKDGTIWGKYKKFVKSLPEDKQRLSK